MRDDLSQTATDCDDASIPYDDTPTHLAGRDGEIPPAEFPDSAAAEERIVFQERITYGTSSELFVTVAEAVSAVTGTAVKDVLPLVHEIVDTDALERIFRPLPDGRQRMGWVTFFLDGCRVVVDGACRLRVYAPVGGTRPMEN